MPPIVVYDACVLFPAPLRDLLVRMAVKRVVRVRWSDEILDECFHAILSRRPDLDMSALARTRELMTEVLPQSLVTDYEKHIAALNLPDPNDRHVLAAAIAGNATAIVTLNIRDFPAEQLSRHAIKAIHPDDFVSGFIESHPDTMISIVREQAGALRNPPHTIIELIDKLKACSLTKSGSQLLRLINTNRL